MAWKSPQTLRRTFESREQPHSYREIVPLLKPISQNQLHVAPFGVPVLSGQRTLISRARGAVLSKSLGRSAEGFSREAAVLLAAGSVAPADILHYIDTR